MKKSLLLLVISAVFNITKTDINVAKITLEEKKHFAKASYISEKIIDKLQDMFKKYDETAEQKAEQNVTFNFWDKLSFKHIYGFKKYQVEVVSGINYEKIQPLSEKERSELIESVKNAIADLQNNEVFGTRVIHDGITVYLAISKIEEIK